MALGFTVNFGMIVGVGIIELSQIAGNTEATMVDYLNVSNGSIQWNSSFILAVQDW